MPAGVLRLLAVATALVASVIAIGVAAERASAHASFVGAQPAPGVRVETAPQRIVLTFTEPLNVRLSRAELSRPGGEPVRLAAVAASERRLVLRPRGELPSGAYTVAWHTVSTQDGHALEGVFSFGVRAEATSAAHVIEQSPLARHGWVRMLLRGALYVTVLLFAAALVLAALLGTRRRSWIADPALARDGGVDIDAVRHREQRLLGDAGWLAVGAAVAATVAEAADAAGGLSVTGLSDFLLSSGAGLGRLGVIAALVVAALLAARHRVAAAVAVTAALGAIAASGHAASASPRTISIVNDWSHLLAGALWLGGIGVLAIVLAPVLRRGGPRARRAVAEHVLPRFGLVALPAFCVVAVTGLISLLLQVSGPAALVTTTYGRVLLLKIVLVGVIALASTMHVLVLRPRMLRDDARPSSERRHWRLLRAEPVIGLVVVAMVAALATFPLPPRQLRDAQASLAAAGAACSPCPLPTPAPDELAVAAQAGTQLVAGWLRRDEHRLTGAVRVADSQGRPSKAPVRIRGAATTSCGEGCVRFEAPVDDVLAVELQEEGRAYVAALPAVWEPDSTATAREVLTRAERTMRRLRAVRQVERISSGPGSFARTVYTLEAPDRMRFRTDRGVETITIGERQWTRTAELPWSSGDHGSGIPFAVRRWFRWSTYATAAKVLSRRSVDGRPVTELALMDPATPVWFRVVVDDRTGRVLREQMTARAHFMQTSYDRFNDDKIKVKAPRVVE